MRALRNLFAAVLAAAAFSLFALDVPPAPTQWFTDRASLVNDIAAQGLNDKLRRFEEETGHQFIIYILPSIENEAIEDFTIRAVDKWKVGPKKFDNGLVLFVFVNEKKVRIEVGYGLEGTVTDAFSSRVIREQIAPHFQTAAYAQGLNAAADALMTRIRGGEANVPPMERGGGQQQGELPLWAVVLILFVVFFVIVPMFSGRRRGGCGGCVLPFFPMGGGGITFGGGGFSGGGFGGGGFGGFSGGGGGFGGGGATGGW